MPTVLSKLSTFTLHPQTLMKPTRPTLQYCDPVLNDHRSRACSPAPSTTARLKGSPLWLPNPSTAVLAFDSALSVWLSSSLKSKQVCVLGLVGLCSARLAVVSRLNVTTGSQAVDEVAISAVVHFKLSLPKIYLLQEFWYTKLYH